MAVKRRRSTFTLVIDRRCAGTLTCRMTGSLRVATHSLPHHSDDRQGGETMELIAALVSIGAIWLIVVVGSIYMNKNVK